MPPLPSSPAPRVPPWLPAAAIALAALLAYHFAPWCGWIWDDDDYVTQNPLLRDLAGLWAIWFAPTELPQYYPAVHTTFWLEFQLWGLHPAGYHVVNVLLHAANAVLVGRVGAQLALPGAWLLALWFAVHPVHVESVAWVTERKNVLSGLFYLLAAQAFLRWQARRAGPAVPWGAFGWFALALLAKTTACSLPAALLLLAWWREGRVERRLWVATLPFFALGLALALVTAGLEREHVRAVGPEFAFTVAERLLIAGRAPWHYLGTLLWPVDLCFNYERWALDPGSLRQWAYPAATVGLLVALFALRHRLGRGPLVALLFFGGTLLPALGFVNVFPMRYSFVADHFQYLASLGPLALAAAALARLGGRLPAALAPRAAPLLGGVLAALLAQGTALQVRAYAGPEALWRDTLAKNPRAWLALTNLAGVHFARGELDAAAALLEQSLQVHDAAETRFAHGSVLQQQGHLERARAAFERGVALDPHRNDVLAGLGGLLVELGQPEAALRPLQQSLAIRDDYDRARAHLGAALLALGRVREAVPHLQRAIALNPQAVDALLSLAGAHARLGEGKHAVLYAANALVRDPAGERTQRGCIAALAAGLPAIAAAERAAVVEELLQKVPAMAGLLPAVADRLAAAAPDLAAALRAAAAPRSR